MALTLADSHDDDQTLLTNLVNQPISFTPQFDLESILAAVELCGRHAGIAKPLRTRGGPTACPNHPSIFNAAMNASCGMSTLPNWRMRFLPSRCLSRSLRLRVASPP